MSQSDIYAPPTVSVAGPTPAELTAKAKGEFVLAGIGQRIGATLIDFVAWIPVCVADAYAGSLSRSADIAMGGVSLALALFLFVGMVGMFEGTPGKLLLGIRVARADGTRVTWKAAALRYSVYFACVAATTVGTAMAVLSMPDESYLTQGYLARIVAQSAHQPAWAAAVNYFLYAWAFACLISLLVTKRHRTLCDFLAGTIVVRSR